MQLLGLSSQAFETKGSSFPFLTIVQWTIAFICRQTLGALVTIDVHNRDVVSGLRSRRSRLTKPRIRRPFSSIFIQSVRDISHHFDFFLRYPNERPVSYSRLRLPLRFRVWKRQRSHHPRPTRSCAIHIWLWVKKLGSVANKTIW